VLFRVALAASIVLSALAGAACAPEGPHIILSVTTDDKDTSVPPLSALARLHLIVRACGKGTLPVNTDIPLTSSGGGPAKTIEAALVPGETFYVWLQGWVACTDTCVPGDNAVHGVDCECLPSEDPPQQIMRSEFCTQWEKVDKDESRVQVPAVMQHVVPGTCPAAPITDCNHPP
jgi:hypothetical protein